MNYKKVYLAKSHLASGLDVEYVKSNLLRLSGIQLVEYGSGIKPSECECIIVIPGDFSLENLSDEEPSTIVSKNLSNVISEFLDNSDKGPEAVLLYLGSSESQNDVEDTTPICRYITDCQIIDDSSWDKGMILEFNEPGLINLLDMVTYFIQGVSDWKSIPRHYVPEDKYALPPIPPLEVRRSAKLRRSTNSSDSLANSRKSTKVNNLDNKKILSSKLRKSRP